MTDSSQDQPTIVLVERAQSDDSAAVEQLFARFLPRVRRVVAIRLGQTREQFLDVDDLAQEAMIDAFRGLSKFDVKSDGKLCNWLAKLVENRIRSTLREGRAQKRGGGDVKRFADAAQSVAASALRGHDATPSQNAVGSELQDRIEEHIHSLRERYREVILHRLFCDMAYDDIAEEMGLAGANVARSLYSKALDELGSLLEPGAEE